MASAPSAAPAETPPEAPPAPAGFVAPPAEIPAPPPPAKPKPADPAALPPPPPLDPVAAGLSYLIPGLGQVYQGRVGKGLLFLAGLYGLFFYGMALGQWKNVWLPDARDLPEVEVAGFRLGGLTKAVSYRPQFLAQFWMGAAVWPAGVQYVYFDKDPNVKAGPVFGAYQRAPTEEDLNALQRDGDKRWDLGWVYTVIAGVLNLLVIYDALAGPMFRDPPPGWKPADEAGW